MTFVLSSVRLGAPAPERLVYVLHGALGAGHNFRGFIRKLAEHRPTFGFVLVDLRHHGASQGAPAPNTLAACAHDLTVLAEHLGRAPECIIGHSFGGKVALQYAAAEATALEQLWMLDSCPGAQTLDENHEVMRVMAAMRAAQTPSASRKDVVSELVRRGMSQGTANWLSANLERSEQGYVWALDFQAIGELMRDYAAVDLWQYLETPQRIDRQLVIAERSSLWTAAARQRAHALPEAAKVHVHELESAGHWLHVDNPDGLLALMSAHLLRA